MLRNVSLDWSTGTNKSHYFTEPEQPDGLLPVIGGCLAVLPPSSLYISMIMLVAYDAGICNNLYPRALILSGSIYSYGFIG
jgi:hypothetical protein